jgi:hypothetical protein
MAKIIIKPQAPAPQSPAGETGHLLQIRVEWVNNQLTNGQWAEKAYLFSKVKVYCEQGELHYDHWMGGFYTEDGQIRISAAHFQLEKPLPSGNYTVRVYRSVNAKTWVADGSVEVRLGETEQRSAATEAFEETNSVINQPSADLRWVSGL